MSTGNLPDITIYQSLIKLQIGLLQYSIESFKVFQNLEFIINIAQEINIEEFENCCNILEKYREKISILQNPNEINQFYLKLVDFSQPYFTRISHFIVNKGHLLNSNYTPENNIGYRNYNDLVKIMANVKKHLFEYIFPPNLIEKLLSSLFNTNTELRNHNRLIYNIPDFDYLQKHQVIIIGETIERYLKIYNIISPKEAYCFYNSLKKEILFDPDPDNEPETLKLLSVNTILETINQNESNTSPYSFNDEQILRLDLVEDLTFYLHSFKSYFDLLFKFFHCLHALLIYHHELEDAPPESDALQELIRLQNYLNFEINKLISLGTIGLSTKNCYIEIALSVRYLANNFLALFKNLLDIQTLANLEVKNPTDIVYKEYFHLKSDLTLHWEYIDSTCDYIEHQDASSLEMSLIKLQAIEMSDLFSLIMLFGQRLHYESIIVDVLQSE